MNVLVTGASGNVLDAVAGALAVALTEHADTTQTWRLTGGETRTFSEAAVLLNEALERYIHYKSSSIPEYVWHLTRRRALPLTQAAVYTVLHTAIRFGAESTADPMLQQVLGRPPNTLADVIRDHLDTLSS